MRRPLSDADAKRLSTLAAPDVRTPGEVGTSDRALREGNESADILAPGQSDSKVLADLKAKLALYHGHAVHDLASGGYLVVATRWGGLCRECPDIRALIAFARQLGVA